MPTKTFLLNLIDGHAIIEENGNMILVDTGTPVSIHMKNTLRFMDSDFRVSQTYGDLTIPALCEFVGTKINTLLGMDILADYKVIFEYPKALITISNDNELPFEGERIALRMAHDIPVINAIVNQKSIPCFFDSGAKLSYLKAEETRNFLNIGDVSDFYPGVGSLQTPSFKIETKVGTRKFRVHYGNLPPKVENQLLSLVGSNNGILGYDFLKKYKIYLHAALNDFKIADSFSEMNEIEADAVAKRTISTDFNPYDPFRDPHPDVDPNPKSDILLLGKKNKYRTPFQPGPGPKHRPKS